MKRLLQNVRTSIGCDLVEVDRIARILKRYDKFLIKHFLKSERYYFANYSDPHLHIAGHFAAKEAVAKALGWGMRSPLDFSTISITHDALGRPQVHLRAGALAKWNQVEFQVSISHTKCHALAVVLAIYPDEETIQ